MIEDDDTLENVPQAPTGGAHRAGDTAAAITLPANFELIRPLGEGAAAVVYLVRDTLLRRLVAIKVLRPELTADTVCCRRFEREAQAAARLSHDNITTVFNLGRLDSGQPFIVMEYVDGANLADLMAARGPLPVEEAVEMLAQIASALAQAHAVNLVHRDVKPANVLVDKASQRACLTDFGVAAILETGTETVTRLTRDNERFGSPRYMSPEQLRGEAVTGQSDIYGLGIIAYELLTGRGPFDDPQVTSMTAAHLRRPPPDPALMRPDLPQPVADLIRRCLAKNPAQRPGAADLAQRLRNPQQSDAAVQSAGPLSGFLRELRQRKVYRAAVAYAAVAFLILQIADLVLPALTESDAAYRLTVLGLLGGFPAAVVLAWLFDLREGRLVRTLDSDIDYSRSGSPALRTALMVVGVGLSIVLVTALAWWLLRA